MSLVYFVFIAYPFMGRYIYLEDEITAMRYLGFARVFIRCFPHSSHIPPNALFYFEKKKKNTTSTPTKDCIRNRRISFIALEIPAKRKDGRSHSLVSPYIIGTYDDLKDSTNTIGTPHPGPSSNTFSRRIIPLVSHTLRFEILGKCTCIHSSNTFSGYFNDFRQGCFLRRQLPIH